MHDPSLVPQRVANKIHGATAAIIINGLDDKPLRVVVSHRRMMGLGNLGLEGCLPLPDFMSPGCGRVYID